MKFAINTKILFLLLSIVLTILVVILVPPLSQDLKYHNFIDQRSIAGSPHFWNVVTNIPFLLIGIIGFFKIQKQELTGILPELFWAYLAFFMGLVLIGLGSGY